jgi:PAS domain S-box-containing protein
MKKLSDTCFTGAELRENAQQVLNSKLATGHNGEIDKKKLLHELQVQQIELEMQNEALLEARNTAEQALERYTRLFNSAPVAYFVLSKTGLIQQTNKQGETLLGKALSQLFGTGFMHSVAVDYRPEFTYFLEQVFANPEEQHCDVCLQITDRVKWVKITATTVTEVDQQTCLMTVMDTTVEHTHNKALQQSNTDFQLLADSIPQIVWITSADGKNIYFNRQWHDYTGLTPTQGCGDDWITPIHPADRQTAWDNWQKAIITKGEYTAECRLLGANGAYSWWLIRSKPILQDDGSVLKWFGTCTNIHQLKLLEQTQRDAEARWQIALENSRQGVWDWDIPAGKIFYSQQWKAILGYADGELFDQMEKWSERVHLDDLPTVRDDLQKHWRGETVFYENEHRERNRNGDYIWIHDRGMVVNRDAAGQPFRMIGTREDITARHKLTEQLKHAESLTSSIMDSLASSIAVLNEEGEILRTNQSWQKFALENNGESLLIGSKRLNYFAVLRDADNLPEAAMILKGMQAVMNGWQALFVAEYPCHAPNIQRWFRLEVLPLKGSIKGLVTHHIDITQRKLAEDSLRESNLKYQELSNYLEVVREEERTRIAREIHDDLGGFLIALKMDLHWLDKHLVENLAEKRKKIEWMVQQTDEATQRVKRIITDLRPSILDHLGLLPAIEWTVEKFQQLSKIKCLLTLPDQNLSLGAEISTAIFRILQEAFTNILAHAQATEVNIAVEILENNILMTIIDNGCGIPAEQQLKATSFGIIGMQERALHFGGLLSITSQTGLGTCLRLSIPLPDS